MGFLTRLLAGLTAAAALGAGLTGTANAVDVTGATGNTKSVVKLAADDTNNLPDHIVNGNFEYPVKSDMPVNDGNFWYISQNDGSYFANGTVLGKRYKLPEGFEETHDGGRAAHVALHFPHPGGGLDGDPAAVEGDALAHHDERSFVGVPGGGVLKDDQARIVGGTGGDGGERAHAEGNDVLAFEYFAVHVVASGCWPGCWRGCVRG